MNNLILFTVRSGSTVLSDIVSYADGSINLGESHSLARSYVYNTTEHKNTELYKLMSTNITLSHHNTNTRGSDHIGFLKAKNQRLKLISESDMPWTIKENTEKLTMSYQFIEHCVNSNANIYMTHRRDIVQQFISNINARYRAEVIKNNKDFIFTNNDVPPDYNDMHIKFQWLHMYTNVFIEQLMLWRIIYDRFKPHIKLVSYEDEIKPMNFSNIGIGSDIVEKYKQESQHLVPTPHNSTNVIVTDDHPKTIKGAWEQSLHYVERFKYLVEI